jgi:copper oxidase (laccase) domain-containing protein
MPKCGGDLPEPEWWAPVQALAAMGVPHRQIARCIGASYSSIKYAVDPAYREKVKSDTRRWHEENPRQDGGPRSVERTNLRRLAREEWRENGREGSLFDLYRKWGCE